MYTAKDVSVTTPDGQSVPCFFITRKDSHIDNVPPFGTCRPSPIYKQVIVTGAEENKLPHIYLSIKKALYGIIQSLLLFYKNLQNNLETERFTMNPYDLCITKKMIDRDQTTITWYENNLKVLHKEETGKQIY